MTKSTSLLLYFLLILMVACSSSTTGTEPDSNKPDVPQDPSVTTGSIEVSVTVSGNETDEDGFYVSINNEEPEQIDAEGSILFEDLEEGEYGVELSGIDAGCSVEGDNPASVEVQAEDIASIDFAVLCEKWEVEGVIAFSRRIDGWSQIFTMNADGSEVERITNSSAEDTYADISPDGQHVVFSRREGAGGYELWKMNIDGSNQQQLTSNTVNDTRPVWSPDGSQIAYESDHEGTLSIFTIDAAGGEPTVLTDGGGNDHSASWSEADHSIAFVSDRQGDSSADIYMVQSDGTDLEILIDTNTDNGINLFYPEWSPDGSQIAYQGFTSTGAAHIFVADANGEHAVIVTSTDVSARQPSWSPDGKNIAFTNLSDGSSPHSVWITKADGSQTRRLTTNEDGASSFPSWGIAGN